MKNISYSIAALMLLILVSCSNNNNKETSEIVQHTAINQSPLDGRQEPVNLTSHRIEVPSEELKPNVMTERKVNEKPQKSIQELTKEIVQIEEQGGLNKGDAMVYYTYGEAMADMEKYTEAIEMYKEAEKRGYEDLKNLHYKIARVYVN